MFIYLFMLLLFSYSSYVHIHISFIAIIGDTVESLLKDTLKGHHRKYLSTKNTFAGTKNGLSYGSNTFFISEEWTTSLQWTNYLVPMCPLDRDSTVPLCCS